MAGASVREVEPRLSAAGWLGTAVIVAIALALGVLAIGLHLKLEEARRLVEAGAAVDGTLTEVLGGARGGSHRYSYQYTVGTTRYTQARRDISYDARYSLKPGDRIQVWHDRASPAKSTTRAELDELESWGNRLFFPVAALALFAWAAARLRRRFRKPA